MEELKMLNDFYKTYSGADAMVFALFPEAKPIWLGSLTTISYSMYRDKKPVPVIGKINVAGFTRGQRIYAGTMVFTLINQHWINNAIKEVPYLAKFGKLKADEIPYFDIMIVCANEYGHYTSMFIYGIDITDEGQIISIQDIMTENTFSFVARNIRNFEEGTGNGDNSVSDNVEDNTISVVDIDVNDNISFDDISFDEDSNLSLVYKNYDNILYIQQMLNNKGKFTPITGLWDDKTKYNFEKIKDELGLPKGNITDDDVKKLDGDDLGNVGYAINKTDVKMYVDQFGEISLNNDIPYSEKFTINFDDERNTADFISVTSNGVIGFVNRKDIVYWNKINSNNNLLTQSQIVLVQNTLNTMYPEYSLSPSGVVDENTKTVIKRYQAERGLTQDGDLTEELVKKIVNDSKLLEYKYPDNSIITTTNPTGNYTIERSDLINVPSDYKININANSEINYKEVVTYVYKDGTQNEVARDINIPKGSTQELEISNEAMLLMNNSKIAQVTYTLWSENRIPIKYNIKVSD
jgi:hypothetical protein